jgi:murein DD-endopeptidase MepM/ murein hydrolase activator NlpD
MKLSRNSKFGILISLLIIILFSNAISANAQDLDVDKIRARIRLLQIKQELQIKVYEPKHLDTVVDGWKASFWENKHCLQGLTRPAKGSLNSETGYRFVPRGSANFNISSTKVNQQINLGADFGKNGDNLDVRATKDSTVISTGESRITGGGQSITIEYEGRDGNKCYQDYNHLSEIHVNAGDTVERGQTIGKMGATGNVTGVHLDWTVYTYENKDWNSFKDLREDGKNYQFIDTSNLFKEKFDKFKYGVFVTDNNKNKLVEMTQTYINKYAPTTPLTAVGLVQIAQDNDFPLDFILVNAHLESHLCTKGRGADSNNCHNVNNTDAGDYKATVCGQYTECHDDVWKGEQKFINLIKNCYTRQGTVPSLEQFIKNDFRVQHTVHPFCSARVGARYMTDPATNRTYINAIQNFINPIFTGYNE